MTRNVALNAIAGFVLALAAAAFVLSYDALYRVALDNGINARLAWLWPLTLDAFMVVASLSALRASLVQESRLYPIALIALSSALSVAFNVAHAPATLQARVVFALPPVVVLLAFELLVSQIASAIRRAGAVQSLAEMQAAIERAGADLRAIEAQADAQEAQPEPQPEAPRGDDLRAAVAALSPDVTNTAAAVALGVSRQRIGAIRAELSRNGHGAQ